MTKEERDAEIKRLWETTDTSMTRIARMFDFTRGQVGGMIRRGGWVSFVKGMGGLPKGTSKPRRLPSAPPKKRPRLPSREGSKPRVREDKPGRTLFDRCNELHAEMDAMLGKGPSHYIQSPTGRSTG